jgi:hypothetical protein
MSGEFYKDYIVSLSFPANLALWYIDICIVENINGHASKPEFNYILIISLYSSLHIH